MLKRTGTVNEKIQSRVDSSLHGESLCLFTPSVRWTSMISVNSMI